MKEVKFIIVASNPEGLQAWGEVKSVDVAGSPTVAHVVISHGHSDLFEVPPGRYSLHFRVAAHGRLTLSTEVDGTLVGPQEDFDATHVTAGRRYSFEVRS